jgi:type IV pilus assembly protein PilB
MRKTLEQLLDTIGVPSEVVENARQRQSEEGGSLRENLIALGEFSEETFADRISQQFRVPYVNLDDKVIPEVVLGLLSREKAEKYVALPIELDKRHRRLSITMADPSDMSAIDELKFVVGYTVIPHYTPEDELIERIQREYSHFEDKQAVAAVWASQASVSENQNRMVDLTSLTRADTPISQFIGRVFSIAYAEKASEILVQPEVEGGRLAFKVDGKIYKIVQFPKKLLHPLISRMKRLFGVDVGEHPRFHAKGYTVLKLQNNKELDLSYLIHSIVQGEEILIKIKDRSAIPMLQDFDLDPKTLDTLQEALQGFAGSIFVTGKARSGMTSTLYAVLATLNEPHRNILSVEDPIECDIEGVMQGQISQEREETYSQYLQYIRAQRPDVIMVDKVVDAKILQELLDLSASTLVLSSLTAVDTATAALKLVLMSEPRLVVDRVSCITSQRLVRRICESCREEVPLAETYREKLGLLPEDKCYVGKGCDRCDNLGYVGLLPIFEAMPFTSDIKQAVIEMRNVRELRNLLADKGILSLRDDGMRRVKQGLTTVQEVLKATML